MVVKIQHVLNRKVGRKKYMKTQVVIPEALARSKNLKKHNVAKSLTVRGKTISLKLK